MVRFYSTLLLTSLTLFSLAGCHFSIGVGSHRSTRQTITPMGEEDTFRHGGGVADTPETQEPHEAEPAIRGTWSEPVNGVRMSARLLRPASSQDQVVVLLLAENVSSEPVEWHGFRAEDRVALENRPDYPGNEPTPCANLRVSVQRLNGPYRQLPDYRSERLEEVEELHAPLLPGEIRLHALRLHGFEEARLMRQWQRDWDSVQMDEVLWPGLVEAGTGRYRVSLTYRPDGAFPVPEGEEAAEQLNHLEPDSVWQGVEIQLPPFEFYFDPRGSSDSL